VKLSFVLSILVACLSDLAAYGGIMLTPGDILVTYDGNILEYKRNGTLVQTIPVPRPGSSDFGSDRLRDVVVDSMGRIDVVNHDGVSPWNRYVSTSDPTSNSWSNHRQSNWIDSGNRSSGYLVAYNGYLWAQNDNFNELGIRFRQSDFASSDIPANATLTIGYDGLLYVIADNNDGKIYVYNPSNLTLLRTVVFPLAQYDMRSIAVNAQGKIFIADWNLAVESFTPTGQLIAAYTTNETMNDIGIDADGKVVATSTRGHVFLFDQSLSAATATSFALPGAGDAFVGFTTPFAVPEPPSWVLAGFASFAAIFLIVRSRTPCG
jgi:streptogramin lyase